MLIGTQWQRFIKMSAYIIEINKFQLANAHANKITKNIYQFIVAAFCIKLV